MEPSHSKPESPLLSLPPELRTQILLHVLHLTLHPPGPTETYTPLTYPSLLTTNLQLTHEFAPLYYGTSLLALSEYYTLTDSWLPITHWKAKRAVFEDPGVVFVDLVGKASLASAMRSCQWTDVGGSRRRVVRRGILAVKGVEEGVGERWWRWSVLEGE